MLHQVTLDGWTNESCGDVDQDGFHASLVIVEPAEQSELANTFDHPIPAGNWVLTQDDRLNAAWRLAALTGMRCGEALGL